jgi:hypothetical protein
MVVWIVIIIFIILGLWILTWLYRGLSSFRKIKQKLDVIEKRILEDLSAQMHLPMEDAWKSAEIVLKERAQIESWDQPPADIADVINKLDSSVQKLFGKYKKISFADNGTLVSAEFLLEKADSSCEYIIGKNDWTKHVLKIRTNGPDVYEVNGSKVIAEYPSIVHYIAFIEDETNWD